MFFLIPEPSQRAIIATDRLDLAVLSLKNGSTWEGADETIRGRIEGALVNAPGINVFSRAQLDSLLAEQMMSDAGLINADTAIEIGSLTGVSKLVTGTVFAVDTRADAATVCLSWENGACAQEGAGTRYSVQILSQITIVNTSTGLIERSIDASGADAITLPIDTAFGGFDSLLASAASQIAETVTASLSEAYTRELRYGLYKSVDEKRGGFVGRNEASRFSASDGTAYLIVHVTRAQSGELFDIEWSNASATFSQQVEDVVSQGDWRLYSLDLSLLPPGRYFVRGHFNAIEVFDVAFTVVP